MSAGSSSGSITYFEIEALLTGHYKDMIIMHTSGGYMTENSVRVELPISPICKIISNFKNIGELKQKYSALEFVKYMYVDTIDNKLKGANPQLKGANPPDELPVVAGAFITVIGDMNEVIQFATDATS